MPFDWFILVALCMSFIVLLWLLKRFFYALKRDNLDTKEQDLQQRCETEYQDFAQLRASLLKEYQDEASEAGKKLIESAQEAADDMLRKRLAALQDELTSIQQKVLSQNIKEVYAVAEKMLHDLIGVELHQAMLSRFTERVKSLSEQEYVSLRIALKRSNNHVVMRSAQALSEQDKLQISRSLSTYLGITPALELDVSFIVVPDFVAGLELSASGWKLGWSMQQHLQKLQENVLGALQLIPTGPHTMSNQEMGQTKASEQKIPVQ